MRRIHFTHEPDENRVCYLCKSSDPEVLRFKCKVKRVQRLKPVKVKQRHTRRLNTSEIRAYSCGVWDERKHLYPFRLQLPIGRASPTLDTSLDVLYCPITDGVAYWGFETQEALEEGNTLYPSIGEQLMMGRRADDSTLDFWKNNMTNASRFWVEGQNTNGESVHATVQRLQRILAAAGAEGNCVWAHGMLFDLGNISNLFESVGAPSPWHYRAPHDLRTLIRAVPEIPMEEVEIEAHRYKVGAHMEDHEPLTDCLYQIIQLNIIRNQRGLSFR